MIVTMASQRTASAIDRSNLVESALLLRCCEKINVIRFVFGIVHYEIEFWIISLVCICYCYGACSEPVIHREHSKQDACPAKKH